MNRKAPLIYFSLCVSLICLIIAGTYFSGIKEEEETESSFFTLGEYRGMLAVYRNDEEIPDAVYAVNFRDIPEEDIYALKKGIRVSDEEELFSLIEDFSG